MYKMLYCLSGFWEQLYFVKNNEGLVFFFCVWGLWVVGVVFFLLFCVRSLLWGNLREAVSFNLRNYLFKLKETSP